MDAPRGHQRPGLAASGPGWGQGGAGQVAPGLGLGPSEEGGEHVHFERKKKEKKKISTGNHFEEEDFYPDEL